MTTDINYRFPRKALDWCNDKAQNSASVEIDHEVLAWAVNGRIWQNKIKGVENLFKSDKLIAPRRLHSFRDAEGVIFRTQPCKVQPCDDE
jgi:hypothetical protein